jgi:hypothetical protein
MVTNQVLVRLERSLADYAVETYLDRLAAVTVEDVNAWRRKPAARHRVVSTTCPSEEPMPLDKAAIPGLTTSCVKPIPTA